MGYGHEREFPETNSSALRATSVRLKKIMERSRMHAYVFLLIT